MIKLLVAVFTIVSLNAIGQTDSAKLKPTVIVQARDCEILLWAVQTLDRAKYQTLDSVLLSKWRPPATAPTGTTNVTIDSVESRAWFNIYEFIKSNAACFYGGTNDRISTNLQSSGHSWLVNKVIKTDLAFVNSWTDYRKDGREYGKKEKTGFGN